MAEFTVAQLVRAGRAILKLNQDQMGEAAGVDPNVVRKMEAGWVLPAGDPRMEKVWKYFSERGLNMGVKTIEIAGPLA